MLAFVQNTTGASMNWFYSGQNRVIFQALAAFYTSQQDIFTLFSVFWPHSDPLLSYLSSFSECLLVSHIWMFSSASSSLCIVHDGGFFIDFWSHKHELHNPALFSAAALWPVTAQARKYLGEICATRTPTYKTAFKLHFYEQHLCKKWPFNSNMQCSE